MKRFWLVLLSLGLVLAFSASAMAVDVKFSGSFYAAGMYLDKTSFNKDDIAPAYIYGTAHVLSSMGGTSTGANMSTYSGFSTYTGSMGTGAMATLHSMAVLGTFGHSANMSTFGDMSSAQKAGNSTAFYYQRLRLQTDFIVSPGLKLVTRFDAMDRIWGGMRSAVTDTVTNSAGTRAENENIAFDWAYIYYTSPIGLFEVGYMADNGWGTNFGNNAINGAPIGAISYTVPIGPFYINAKVGKNADYSRSAVNPGELTTDSDDDSYSIGVIYVPNKDIQVGFLGAYKRIAGTRIAYGDAAYLYPFEANAYAYSANPYFKVKVGPVALEGELNYVFGQVNYESTYYPEIGPYVAGQKGDVSNLTVYLNALADFGMFYGGATFAYVSGDDATTGKYEGSFIDGGVDFQPCLIMFNAERNYRVGGLNGYGGITDIGRYYTSNSNVLSNAWFLQGKAGVRPIAPLDIMASVSWAAADQKNGAVSADYGWEVDVTGTYKLTNNLSYMLGAAYLFTGDYYKGSSAANAIQNDYMLINKLTLTF